MKKRGYILIAVGVLLIGAGLVAMVTASHVVGTPKVIASGGDFSGSYSLMEVKVDSTPLGLIGMLAGAGICVYGVVLANRSR